MNEYIKMLGEKTLKARTKLASEFVREVVECAPKAATFGLNTINTAHEDQELFDNNGFYIHYQEYIVIHKRRMNHDHAAAVLERIGFDIEWEHGRISAITWPVNQ